MSMVVAWEDPPKVERNRPPGRWDETIEKLQAQPGRWAKIVVEESRGKAVGVYQAFRYRKGFDACTRSLGDGTFAVYARWVGEPDA